MSYSHTEQDVIETLFPPLVASDAWANASAAGVAWPAYRHAGFLWIENTAKSRLRCRYDTRCEQRAILDRSYC